MVDKKTRTAASVGAILTDNSLTQSQLASMTNSTPAYTNMIVHGKKIPSAKWLDLVASATGVGEEKRRELHRAAASDILEKKGYDVDLTKE